MDPSVESLFRYFKDKGTELTGVNIEFQQANLFSFWEYEKISFIERW